MERPQIRVVKSQETESKEVSVDSYEAQQLLWKYGHSIKEPEINQVEPTQDNGMTFEEMVKIEQKKRELESIKKMKKDYGPKPITFSDSNYSSDVKYGQDDESGINFRIEITTDMKLPK